MGSKIKRSFDLKESANYRKLCLATKAKSYFISIRKTKKLILGAQLLNIPGIKRAVGRTENSGVPVVMYWA